VADALCAVADESTLVEASRFAGAQAVMASARNVYVSRFTGKTSFGVDATRDPIASRRRQADRR
jgi:hypothetical protein